MFIKILVAAHKPYWMPTDAVYLPVHVGAEGKNSIGYTPDNTGDNISSKNPNFCELTGLYWAWKNLDADYIGLVHYRRYFTRKEVRNMEAKKQQILTEKEWQALLIQHPVIVRFVSELLLDVWLEHNYIDYVEQNVSFMEKQDWIKKGGAFLKRKIFGR